MSNSQQVRYVLVIEEPKSSRTIALVQSTYSIGRHSSNSIVLNSKQVSRKHATLMRKKDSKDNDGFWIIDGDGQGNRSNNGIYINGQRRLEQELKQGDVVKLGGEVKITYQIMESEDSFDVFGNNTELLEKPYDTNNISITNQGDLARENSNSYELMKLASFPESMPNPIVEMDIKGRIIYLNPAAKLKFQNIEEANKKHPLIAGLLNPEIYRDDRLFDRQIKIGEEVLEQYVHYLPEQQLLRSYLFEITDRKRSQERLEYLAYHDLVTDLPNRQYFQEQLATALANAAPNQNTMAVLFIKLDGCKNIDDTLGYEMGDRLLKAFAKRLGSCISAEDLVGRWGSNEFTVLLRSIKNAEEPGKVSQKIIYSLDRPFAIDNYKLKTNIRIGIALYPQDGEDGNSLIRNADAALCNSQEQGGNSYCFYSQKSNLQASTWLKMSNLLQNALERKEFVLHYLPEINARSGGTYGVEALLRWENSQLGLVNPDKFIPVAEQNGSIVPIGEWVLQTACAQSKAWQDQGLPPIRMAVNLSWRQFKDKNIVAVVSKVLSETGLAPNLLELEITETTLMQDVSSALKTMHDLQRMGVNMTIDDFGIGYSSLAYLRKFNFNVLKIDRFLVQETKNDPRDLAFMSALVSLGHSLNLRVVAKGIETQEQLTLLRSLQCEEMQGYFLSKPLTAEEATTFLSIHSTITTINMRSA